MRDSRFWSEWLRKHAEELAPTLSSLRDWYRAAGVRKGERRHFRSALQQTSFLASGRRRGKTGRRRAGGESRPAGRGTRPTDRQMDVSSGPRREGRLRITREGRPIVLPDSPEEPVIRVPGNALAGAWPRDRVEVRLERRRGGAPPYGRVVRIVERGIREFVGRFSVVGRSRFVRFRDREGDLLVPATVPGDLHPRPGELVLAEVSEYPGPEREGRVRVVRTLGTDPTMETIVLSVVSTRNIPSRFPEEVEAAAAGLPRSVRPGGDGGPSRPGELRRIDQRHLPFVTIDGEDARDFDDAVCLVRDRGILRLYVAIADVSFYVPPGSEIDREAYRRGTSVYFPDRCIPMLPPPLSEGICSLKPRVNRLTVTAEIPFSSAGTPLPPSFYPSLIRSRARLTYAQVHAHLSGGPAGSRAGIREETGGMLREMEALARRLSRARSERGALDLDLPEAKIDVVDGLPARVAAAPRWEAHRIIEEFMLLANAAVAEFLVSKGRPFPFRIHEPPEEERVREFEETAARLLRRSRATESREISRRLQAWADAARGGSFEKRVHLLLLRSLMLARYAPEEKGHFGLALSRYTHFTSPIRRYPDLVVHRALKAALGDRQLAGYAEALAARGKELGEHVSARERAAMDGERDVMARGKALFLSKRIGETFPATIASVTRHGFFVELEAFPIEGYVSVATLRDDVYRFSAEREEWYGTVRKRRLAPADRIRVRLFRTDVDRGE
ncbi:MAG TPA: VacB/RNase II family 3'-5' exoribonuclease, partial [Candidatus Deferrimicrobiaceae bacterium]